MIWYRQRISEILEHFKVSPEKGLSAGQFQENFKTYGPNILATKKRESLLDIFVRQFKSPLIYILISAAFLVLILGQSVDALVILAVIIINSIVGTIQEGRARNSLEKLKTLTRHKALVRRDSQETYVPADELVPGDILVIREGDKVLADARIIRSEGLKLEESVLTGEAQPTVKTSKEISKVNLTPGDQVNMVFAGTNVVSGYGEGIVVATGFESEIGKISKELLETSHVPLPLAQKITKLSHFIALATFSIASSILVIGLVRGIPFRDIFTAVIGLSVSIVPEGLPVAVTIVLAHGVWRMARSKAIVRQMAAVEAMGGADTLLVDKTGTITTGKMLIKEIHSDGQIFQVTGEGYNPKGKITGSQEDLKKLKEVLALTYLSLKADVVKGEDGSWQPSGDPTEAALAVVCKKSGLAKEKLEGKYKTIISKPFDSEKRYIEASFENDKKWNIFIGAPEVLVSEFKINHGLSRKYSQLAKKGFRIIAVAIFEGKEKLFNFSLYAIEEEVRPSVRQSVEEAKKAGFRIIMMTGDYKDTARAIAQNVGIFEEGDTVLTGEDLGKLSDQKLLENLEKTTVFARITPTHKLKIVKLLQKNEHVCAMTGDGVNDGPALQAANLGISLGSGTQVAKDASDIVLIDNDFKTITEAISEGRNIYLTLKKVILYLVSTSLGEVLVIAGAVIIGLPLPLVAVQIIWLNFVTDGFFVVALAQDHPQTGLLSRFQVEADKLIDKKMLQRIALMGASMLIATLPIYAFYQNLSLSQARSIALLILSISQWFNSLNVRSQNTSIFRTGLNNPYLIASFVIVTLLQYIAVQTKIGNSLLHTSPLGLNLWILSALLSCTIIAVEEIRKILQSKKSLSLGEN